MSTPYGAASGIVLSRDRTAFLLVPDRHDERFLQLPGGRLQANETPAQTFHRKCLQESGVAVNASLIVPLIVMPYVKREGEFLHQSFLCTPEAVLGTFEPADGRSPPEWHPLEAPPWHRVEAELYRRVIVRAQRLLGHVDGNETALDPQRTTREQPSRKKPHNERRRVGYLRMF